MATLKKRKLTLDEILIERKIDSRLPHNWLVCNMSIFSFEKGKKPTKLFNEPCENAIPYVNIKCFETGEIEQFTCPEYSNRICKEDDILIVWDGARAGLVGIGTSGAVGSTLSKINYSFMNKQYVYYYFISNFECINRNTRGTGIPHVDPSFINMLTIPIPPLAEQQRIVERIESLFEKLDAAKELAQNALDSFENRKAAILHKAFTGELTAKWREENGVSLDSWEERKLSELCDGFQYGTSKKSQEEGEVAVLRMGNLQNGEIEWDKLVFTSDAEDIDKYLLKSGDVLFNRTNSAELVGKTSIYRGEYPAIFAGYLIRINYKPCINGEYLNYMLNSPRAKAYCNQVKSDGVNQSNINAKKLGEFSLPLCSLAEQLEIVKIINRLLREQNQAQQLCSIIDRIDLMKKAILARAFRGELGTNNPEEESAIELLKEVLKEKL